jgi:hypothetical protein
MTTEERLARLELLVEETHRLAEETNLVVRQLRREARLSFWLKIVVWTAVIILPFLLIGPVIRAIMPGAGGAGLFGLPSAEQLNSAAEMYRSLELPQ